MVNYHGPEPELMTQTYKICPLRDLPENSARGFLIESGATSLKIFIIRKDGELRGYLNRCPHTGVNLDWLPDQFLDWEGEMIQCATHGALFRIHDGFCTYGPCAGQSLIPVTVEIRGEEVQLLLPEQI